MLTPPCDALADELRGFIPAARLVSDPLRLLAHGPDVSFCRLVPKLVAMLESEAEVVGVLRACRRRQPLGAGGHRLGAGAAGRRLVRLHHWGRRGQSPPPWTCGRPRNDALVVPAELHDESGKALCIRRARRGPVSFSG